MLRELLILLNQAAIAVCPRRGVYMHRLLVADPITNFDTHTYHIGSKYQRIKESGFSAKLRPTFDTCFVD